MKVLASASACATSTRSSVAEDSAFGARSCPTSGRDGGEEDTGGDVYDRSQMQDETCTRRVIRRVA